MTIPALAVTMILVMITAILVVILFSIPLFIRLTLQVLDTTTRGSLSLTCCGVGLYLVMGGDCQTLSVTLAGRPCIPIPLTIFTARTRDRERERPETMQKRPFIHILHHVGEIIRCATGFISDSTLTRCSGMFRIGLGSAADTGRLYGYYAAIRPALVASRRFSFILVPVFDCHVLEGDIAIDLKFSRPFVHIIRFIRLFRLLETRQKVFCPGSDAAV